MGYILGHKHPVDQYLAEIHDGLGYYATWNPNLPLKIGDIGTVDHNRFHRASNLKHIGIDFKTCQNQASNDMLYASANAVDIYSKAAGKIDIIKQLLGGVDADFAIHFKRENAVYLTLGNCQTHYIEDQYALAKGIEKKHDVLEWDPDWTVITELITANNGLVAISGSKEACIGFNLAGDTTIPYVDLNVANAKVGLQLVGGHELFFKSCTCERITPLFQLSRLQSQRLLYYPTLAAPELGNVGGTVGGTSTNSASANGSTNLEFAEVKFDPQQLGELTDLKQFAGASGGTNYR